MSQIKMNRVGIVHDDDGQMILHVCKEDPEHQERPDRIDITWERLMEAGLTVRCKVIRSREARIEDLSRVHSNEYINFIKSSRNFDEKELQRINKVLDIESVYLNNFSWKAAIVAAGSFLKVCSLVARGRLDSGVAVIRPPGHHAEHNIAKCFCLFNNVAIAAKYLLEKVPSIRKVLIVDWDVHHGNGTQHTFFDDDRVLFFSVHRYDNGKFYPSSKDANYTQVGSGVGEGYNINVPLSSVGGCRDADYFAVWDQLLLPIVEMFVPDIILVSGGFDAAEHDVGGYHVTPRGFGKLLQKLMPFAQGKIVMALEGGYELTPLTDSLAQCIQTLLGDEIIYEGNGEVSAETNSTIKKVQRRLHKYWSILGQAAQGSEKLIDLTGASNAETSANVDSNVQNFGSGLHFRMKSRVQISPKKRPSLGATSGNKRRRGRFSPKKSVGSTLGRKNLSKSRRAGLVFPVGRITRFLKTGRHRVGRRAPVYLAAGLEYLAAEVLEMAGDWAKSYKKARILPSHILCCIREDGELRKLLADAIIPYSGNLLPKYPKNCRKRGKNSPSPDSLRRSRAKINDALGNLR